MLGVQICSWLSISEVANQWNLPDKAVTTGWEEAIYSQAKTQHIRAQTVFKQQPFPAGDPCLWQKV